MTSFKNKNCPDRRCYFCNPVTVTSVNNYIRHLPVFFSQPEGQYYPETFHQKNRHRIETAFGQKRTLSSFRSRAETLCVSDFGLSL